MLGLPSATAVRRHIPKEDFYRHLRLSGAQKAKFISDISKITVEHSLTAASLNLPAGEKEDREEILALSVLLKKRDLDAKLLHAIASQNPHKLLFVLQHEGGHQLALHHGGKLYRTPWQEGEAAALPLPQPCFSIDGIWSALVAHIALGQEEAAAAATLPVDQRLALQEQIVKLEKLITRTEAAAWRQQQPKKQFALHQRLQEYRKELQRLRGSAT